jgi:hypothetical protein
MDSDAGDDMPFETLRNLINFYLDLAGQEFPFTMLSKQSSNVLICHYGWKKL